MTVLYPKEKKMRGSDIILRERVREEVGNRDAPASKKTLFVQGSWFNLYTTQCPTYIHSKGYWIICPSKASHKP